MNHDITINQTVLELTFKHVAVLLGQFAPAVLQINHRNEPEELVFIRIDPAQKKNLRISGRMLIATYPKAPSVREMRKDFKDYVT
jgi:hypothetical protein